MFYKDPEYRKNYYRQNKEKLIQKSKEYYKKNKENVKNYYEQNKEQIREKSREYRRNRYKTDLNFRLKCSLRRRIRKTLKNHSKSAKTLELLGCTPKFLRSYLESKFLPGMSWENYGNPNGDHSDCWHIDHIKPCAGFDLSDPEQQKMCFHYTNLQPLWAKDNLKKGRN